MIRPALALLALLGLAACAAPARLHGSAAQEAACSKRADEVYERQNRGAIYRADSYATSGRDAPFGGSGYLNAPSLSDQYAREQIRDNCLSGRSNASANDVAPSAAPSAPKTALPPPKP